MGKPTDKMLGIVLRAWRERERMGMREAARTIGISHATLSRIENGRATDGHTLWRVLVWLNGPPVSRPNQRDVSIEDKIHLDVTGHLPEDF